MAFVGNTSSRQQVIAAAENKEIRALVAARGFDPSGTYRFEGTMNTHRKPGSITNGEVNGSFVKTNTTNDDGPIVFEKINFDEKSWRKICALCGYKYHVHADINKIAIDPKSIEVFISLSTASIQDD